MADAANKSSDLPPRGVMVACWIVQCGCGRTTPVVTDNKESAAMVARIYGFDFTPDDGWKCPACQLFSRLAIAGPSSP